MKRKETKARKAKLVRGETKRKMQKCSRSIQRTGENFAVSLPKDKVEVVTTDNGVFIRLLNKSRTQTIDPFFGGGGDV